MDLSTERSNKGQPRVRLCLLRITPYIGWVSLSRGHDFIPFTAQEEGKTLVGGSFWSSTTEGEKKSHS